jgi:ABC-type uncharacterized transport system auxiliary subunit
MTRATAFAAALLLSACVGGTPTDPVRYFVLDPAPGVTAAHRVATAVIVSPTTAANFYGNTRIVYSDMPGVRARYRYSFWTERPQRVIHMQLQSRLQPAGATGRAGQLLLDTHVDDIYHDARTSPGAVQVTVTASLWDSRRNALVASRRFTRSVPATSYDAPGVAAGMRKAVGAVLDDIVAWVESHAMQAAKANEQGRNWRPVQDRPSNAGLDQLGPAKTRADRVTRVYQ